MTRHTMLVKMFKSDAVRVYKGSGSTSHKKDRKMQPLVGHLQKTCVICGKTFSKPANVHGKAWRERQTCGRDCGAVLHWNNRGRKPRPTCRTCRKPVPKPSMVYCSLECRRVMRKCECRRVMRKCEWCGQMASMKAHHKYCSRRCSGEAHRTPTESRTCIQCGNAFEYKPRPTTSGLFCSRACSGRYNQERGIVPDPLSPEQTAARIAGVKASPLSGPFVTHHSAEDWFLLDPNGAAYHVRNLQLFIREHADLFSGYELARVPSGQQRAYSGLTGLNPNGNRKRVPSVWHGWRWWHEGELRWRRALPMANT